MSAWWTLLMVGLVIVGCSTTPSATDAGAEGGVCTLDRCVASPLSCVCANGCPKLEPSTGKNLCGPGAANWAVRYQCGSETVIDWFDTTGRHSNVYDGSGVQIGHTDSTDSGLCLTKVYGTVSSCHAQCVPLCGGLGGPVQIPCHEVDGGATDASVD